MDKKITYKNYTNFENSDKLKEHLKPFSHNYKSSSTPSSTSSSSSPSTLPSTPLSAPSSTLSKSTLKGDFFLLSPSENGTSDWSVSFTPNVTVTPSSIVPFTLTDEQNEALEHIKTFLKTPINVNEKTTQVALLEAVAGCGKTTLMKFVVQYIRKELKKEVMCVAPTHRARKVIENIINEKSLFKFQACTIASLLNKTRSHSYIGTRRYESNGENKIAMFDIFIIDEISMTLDSDINEIEQYAKIHQKKILYIGDIHQIPNPSQGLGMYRDDNDSFYCEKKDSKAFLTQNKSTLHTVMRQDKENDMVDFYDKIRQDLNEDSTFSEYHGKQVDIYSQSQVFDSKILEEFKKNKESTRVLVYTNNAVQYYNELIRKSLYEDKEDFHIGEILMGYTNIGYPVHIIENGQDYIISSVRYTKTHRIDNYTACGHLVETQEIFPSLKNTAQYLGAKQTLFFPEIEAEENYDLLNRLIELAEKVNSKDSTKIDFAKYSQLKSRIIFRKNIYKYNKHIEAETSFKKNHSLLFSNVNDVIETSVNGDRCVVENELYKDLMLLYPNLINDRLKDTKSISDDELFADQFQILEKDIDYGYAITAHKSQGSTIDVVFINDNEFDRIKNTWNARKNMVEKRMKEKNQLRYVCYTRAKKHLYVLTSKKK